MVRGQCVNSFIDFSERNDALETGNATYKPAGCRRYTGTTLPPHGTPTVTSSLENLNERLERLAFGRRPVGHNAPPLETYTTTSTEHGDVVSATSAYREWFLRAYPKSRSTHPSCVPAPGPAPQRVGGEEGPAGAEITF